MFWSHGPKTPVFSQRNLDFFRLFRLFKRKLKPWKIIEIGKTPVFSQLNLDFFRFFWLFRLFGKRFGCLAKPASWPGSQPAGQPTSQSTCQLAANQPPQSESQLFLKKSEKSEQKQGLAVKTQVFWSHGPKTPVFSQLNLDSFRLFRLFKESWNLGKS